VTRRLNELSGFDSEAQSAASEEATSREASRTQEKSRASEQTREAREMSTDGWIRGTQQVRFDLSATGNFYTSILNFLGDRVKDKQRRAKVQMDQGKCK
jgi:hypothetical protein